MKYFQTVMIGLDQLGAAILFNRNDFTISSLCGIVRNAKVRPGGIEALKLSPWQRTVLEKLGVALNWVTRKNHCQDAIISDLARSTSTSILLKDQIL